MSFLIEQCTFFELTEDVLATCQPFSCGNADLDDFFQNDATSSNKTGCRFVIVDAVNDPQVLSFYEKNDFRPLFPTEKQEFAYTMGKKDTPVKLDTRLMYFDLLKLRQE